MSKKFFIICAIGFLISVISGNAFAQEQITITTYYPSPYGVYNEMRLYPHTPATTPCSATQEGLMFYDSDKHNLYVCRYNGTIYAWEPAGGYWTTSPTNPDNIYNTNSGNVGIGTTEPGAKLQVETGGAQRSAIFGRHTVPPNVTTPSRLGVHGETWDGQVEGALGTSYYLNPQTTMRVGVTGRVNSALALNYAGAFWGPVQIYASSAGASDGNLLVNNDLLVANGGIALGGVRRTTWPVISYVSRTANNPNPGETNRNWTARCDTAGSGYRVVGGGFNHVDIDEDARNASYPDQAVNGWRCINNDYRSGNTCWAVCLRLQ